MPNPTAAPTLIGGENEDRVVFAVSRDYEPVPGQWYENLEEEESFRVLSVDEDSERLEIEYLPSQACDHLCCQRRYAGHFARHNTLG